MDLTQALREHVALFDKLGIPYVVMGGLAVRVYGIPRPTHDVGFTLSIPRQRLPELYGAVQALGYSVPEPYLSGWVDEVAGMPVVKLRFFLEGRSMDIDLFLAASPFQEEIIRRRRWEKTDDTPIWLVSAEDLILLKLLANRPRDLADVGDVLFTQGQLNTAHMRRWADFLGIRERLEKVLAESEYYKANPP